MSKETSPHSGPKGNLPYKVFDLAESLFGGDGTGFSHADMAAFFCHELNKHPSDIGIPADINRIEKFKWFLRLLPR